ncbi:rod shape-determining protein [Nonomuraea sp. NPDC050663]|uniref:rod shape-determining protein n=1 Tax=Nonomuraea sp. NPDC050663 TaxID=3364370 RepID=UPI003798DB1F
MGFGLLGRDLAVDLGTANTLVYIRRKGIVLNEPSVVAIDLRIDKIVAVGKAAKKMEGRTPPHISVIRPLKDGVIADLDAAERMLRYFIQKTHRNRYLAKPRVVVAVPSGTTGIEQRAVKEAAYDAGARRVHLIEEPMAAAIGAGLRIGEPTGNMVVDIGGGTTEVAIVSMSGSVVAKSVRVGGDELDEAIITYAKKEHAMLLGERTAERVKIVLGSVWPSKAEARDHLRRKEGGRTELELEPRGRHRVSEAVEAPADDEVAGEPQVHEKGGLWARLRPRQPEPSQQERQEPPPPEELEVRGRDLVSGLPKTVMLTAANIREAVEEPVQSIIDAVQTTLDQCPAELAGDLIDNGITLTGGGALLRGLAGRMRLETGMPVHLVDKPLYSVALGAGRCIERFAAMQGVLLPEARR